MPVAVVIVAAVAALAIGAPLVALAGRGVGRRTRGNLQLAAILLGLGEPVDPPAKHLAAAGDREEEGGAPPSEPLRPGS
jgi:hypothetical protein